MPSCRFAFILVDLKSNCFEQGYCSRKSLVIILIGTQANHDVVRVDDYFIFGPKLANNMVNSTAKQVHRERVSLRNAAFDLVCNPRVSELEEVHDVMNIVVRGSN